MHPHDAGTALERDAVTAILNAPIDAGDRIKGLLPLVYHQLRATAKKALDHERADHTLQATALVHEAYLRLVGDRDVPWANRAHFYFAASEAMRRILIEHARSRGRIKRGGGRRREQLGDVMDLAQSDPAMIEAIDAAVTRLTEESPDLAAVIQLRFYAGLSVEKTAEALGEHPSKIKRRWAVARAWLFQQLGGGGEGPASEDAP